MNIPLFQHCLLKTIFPHWNLPYRIVKRSINQKWKKLLLDSQMFSFDLYIFPVPHSFDYCMIIVIFEIESINPPTFILFQTDFGYFQSFAFNINSKCGCRFLKMTWWYFNRNYFEFIDQFERISTIAILSVKIEYFFIYPFISLSNVLFFWYTDCHPILKMSIFHCWYIKLIDVSVFYLGIADFRLCVRVFFPPVFLHMGSCCTSKRWRFLF